MFGPEVLELVVAVRLGVVVHEIHVGLRVVVVHHVVPPHGVETAHESSVEDGQLPVFAVVDLSGSGQNDGQPHGPLRVGAPRAPVALALVEGIHQCADGLFDIHLKRVGHGSVHVEVHEERVAQGFVHVERVHQLHLHLGLSAKWDTRHRQGDGQTEGSQYVADTVHSSRLLFVLQSVEHTEYLLQLVFIGEGDADFAFSLGRAGHFHLRAEHFRQLCAQLVILFGQVQDGWQSASCRSARPRRS